MRNWHYSAPILAFLLSGCREKDDISPLSENTSTSDTTSLEDICLFPTEKMPEFPGGIPALSTFLQKNLSYPSSGCVSGRVFVGFTIDTDGKITDPKILKGLSPEYDAEVLRVVGLMPKWTPGEWFDGRKITVRYALPVRFGIDEAVKEGFEADFKPF